MGTSSCTGGGHLGMSPALACACRASQRRHVQQLTNSAGAFQQGRWGEVRLWSSCRPLNNQVFLPGVRAGYMRLLGFFKPLHNVSAWKEPCVTRERGRRNAVLVLVLTMDQEHRTHTALCMERRSLSSCCNLHAICGAGGRVVIPQNCRFLELAISCTSAVCLFV